MQSMSVRLTSRLIGTLSLTWPVWFKLVLCMIASIHWTMLNQVNISRANAINMFLRDLNGEIQHILRMFQSQRLSNGRCRGSIMWQMCYSLNWTHMIWSLWCSGLPSSEILPSNSKICILSL